MALPVYAGDQEMTRVATFQHIQRLRQNGWHFNNKIFRLISLNDTYCNFIPLSLKFVPETQLTVNHDRFNSSPSKQFGGKIADDIFKCIFFNENDWMSIKISMKFIPEGSIDNKSVFAQVMAWRRQATSHYLNQCWPSFLTHICRTQRWVK